MSLATRQGDEPAERSALTAVAPESVPPGHALTILLRRKLLFLLLTLGLAIPSLAVIAILPPYYDAEALILIATGKGEFGDALAHDAAGAGLGPATLRTQADIIRSPMLAARVVDQLGLTGVSEFVPQPGWLLPMMTQAARWLRAQTSAAVPPELPPGDAAQRQAVAARLLDKLVVLNDGRSSIITVRVRTRDRALAAHIANAYANAYLAFAQQLKLAAIARGNALLDAQLAPRREQVRLAEEAVERFRESNGLVTNHAADPAAGQAETVAGQQLGQINSQLIIARGDLAQKEANLRAAQHSGGRGEAVPEVVASPLVQRLREQEAALSEREASLGKSLLGDNPALQAARAARAEMHQRIEAEIGKILASLGSEVAAARARRDALEAALAQAQAQVTGQSQANVTLRQLESEADAARAVYKEDLWRYEQTSNQAALQQPDADLIAAAEAPFEPAGPPRKPLAVLAALGGLLVAAAVSLAVERRRGGVRTAEQLQSETGLFPLGFIPAAALRQRPWLAVGTTPYLAAVDLVASLLQHGDAAVRARVVLVTSAAPQEGKSVFAVSLAASVGRSGGRALLVDCDVWRPRLATLLGVGDAARPSDAAGSAAPVASLRNDVLPGLDMVSFAPPVGKRPRPITAAQLGLFLGEARERYDLVVLDTPPVLAFADAAVLAPLADGAILVVRWHYTQSVAVLAALRTLRAFGARVLGGVITQVKVGDLAQSEAGHARLYRGDLRYVG